jgi:hypothetical protein
VLLQRIKRWGKDFDRRFDGRQIDFVSNETDWSDLLSMIGKMRKGTQHDIPLASRR